MPWCVVVTGRLSARGWARRVGWIGPPRGASRGITGGIRLGRKREGMRGPRRPYRWLSGGGAALPGAVGIFLTVSRKYVRRSLASLRLTKYLLASINRR